MINLHLISWMGTVMRLRANCVLGDLFAIMWKCVVFDIGHRSLLIAARRSTVCMYACMLYAISVTEA